MATAPHIRLSTVIMAHPRRLNAARALRDLLPDLDPQIVLDPDPEGPPSAWRTARLAWSAVPDDATHHLVLQDDVTAAPDFGTRARAAVRAEPTRPISLFTEWGSRTASAVRLAAACGRGWTEVVDDYVPTVGLVLPAELARGLGSAADPAATDPDDVILLDYLRARGVAAIAPVDGPLQHDVGPSLVGNAIMGLRRAVRFARAVDCPPAQQDHAPLSPRAIPYYDWWDQQAAMFVPDTASADGWSRLRSGPAFAHLGTSLGDADRRFDATRPSWPDRRRRDDRVSDIIQRELWRTAYLLGAVAADAGARPDQVDDPRFRSALRTLAPGGLRRIIPVHLLDEVTSLLDPLVSDATAAGLTRQAP